MDTELHLDGIPPSYLKMSPRDPRTVPPSHPTAGFSAYTLEDSSSFLGPDSTYGLSSTLTASHNFAHQSQYPLPRSGPWTAEDAAQTTQTLPFHSRSDQVVPVQRPSVPHEVLSSLPRDSSYRGSSHYEAQSFLSTPATSNMENFFQPQPSDYSSNASFYQEQDPEGSQVYAMNYQDADNTSQYDIDAVLSQDQALQQQVGNNFQQGFPCETPGCGASCKTPSELK
jgi:hypothetical protein